MTIFQLFDFTLRWIRSNWISAVLVYGLVFVVAFTYTILRPREYVVSMVVLPIDATFSDPTSLVSTSGFSIRTPLQFGQHPPLQLGAFLRLLKSPELAQMLAAQPQLVDLIRNGEQPSLIRQLIIAIRGPGKKPTAQQNTAMVYSWLQDHITTEQDVDVGTWGLQIRYPTANGGLVLLDRIHAGAESILRKTEIEQLAREWTYGTTQLQSAADTTERTTLFSILNSLQRSLLVLRSGANVATIVISQPYAPIMPTYPSALITLISSLVPLLILATAVLAYLAFRGTKRRYAVETVHAAAE